MRDLLVGVDVGTSRLKVGVFDAEGGLLVSAQRDCPPDYLLEGRIEIGVERWWSAFEGALGDCLKETNAAAVRAIGVSSQAQSYVLLDEGGAPLGPAVSWLAAWGDAEGTANDLAEEDYYAHTGWSAPDPMLAACKLKQDAARPDARARRVLFADAYLMFRLTGVGATSRNLAAMSGLYSMKLNDWWAAALTSAGVPRAWMPQVVETGDAVGALRPELAERWRMNAVPVVAGANDQTAAALGLGLCAPGEVALGLGTALAAYQVIDAGASPHPERPLRGPYVGGLGYQIALSSTAGAAVGWTRDLLAPDKDEALLYAEALAVEPGCGGLRARPDFGDAPGSAGALLGLGLQHARGHVFRAVLEAVACVAREKLDMLDAPAAVRVSGGGAANDEWLRLLADVTGRTLERPDEPQAGLRGTALAAGCGAGMFDDMTEAVRARRPGGETFPPSGRNAGAYARLFQDYLALKSILKKP